MGRILAIDYGKKRVGIAVTDPLKIIASGLTTVAAHEVIKFLLEYTAKETVECFVIGHAKQLNGTDSESMNYIIPFTKLLKSKFPLIPIEMVDERFTSKIAFQTMIDGGLKKKDRRNKELVDTISAALILQTYLDMKSNKK